MHAGCRALHLVKQLTRFNQKPFTAIGQHGAAGVTGQQAGAQFSFQTPYIEADPRLGLAQQLGSLGKAAAICNGDKAGNAIEVEHDCQKSVNSLGDITALMPQSVQGYSHAR
ncbi:hypothetical protein D3C79_731110 [compost metagenome]